MCIRDRLHTGPGPIAKHRTRDTRTSSEHNTRLSGCRPRCPVAGHRGAQLRDVTSPRHGMPFAGPATMQDLLEAISRQLREPSAQLLADVADVTDVADVR